MTPVNLGRYKLGNRVHLSRLVNTVLALLTERPYFRGKPAHIFPALSQQLDPSRCQATVYCIFYLKAPPLLPPWREKKKKEKRVVKRRNNLDKILTSCPQVIISTVISCLFGWTPVSHGSVLSSSHKEHHPSMYKLCTNPWLPHSSIYS